MTGSHCEHCGAKITAYWHKLTPGLVETLVKVYKRVCEKGENAVHKDELTLNHSEYGNFQKLRFHALVAKYKENGIWIRGKWVLTRRAALFLKGELAIPDKVRTFRNKVEAHSDKAVTVGEVMKSNPYWQEYSDFIQLQQDHEFAEVDQEIDQVPAIKRERKKKGKKYCPKCDVQLKIKIDDNTYRRTWACPTPSCDHEEPYGSK